MISSNIEKDVQNSSTKCCGWLTMGVSVGGLIFLLDQLTKWMVLKHYLSSSGPVPVTSFFNIVLAWNRGVSFGLLSTNHSYGPWILIGIALGLVGILVRWMWQAQTKSMIFSYGLILGGALGNLVDRIRFGAVTDFLDFHLYGYHWYTFNIADTAIVCGVAWIFFVLAKENMNKKDN